MGKTNRTGQDERGTGRRAAVDVATAERRGNVETDWARQDRERDEALDALEDELVCGVYVPREPPLDERRRNNMIQGAIVHALRVRGFEGLAGCVAWMTYPDEPIDVFDVLMVLAGDYSPHDTMSTPERDDLYRALPKAIFEDKLLAELCFDAMLCMGVGEDEAYARLHLEDGDERDGGDWTEFRVSLRVALEARS